jgi:hypothetical protein
VKRMLGVWLFLSALAAIPLMFARFLAPGRFELELDVYILATGGLALMLIVLLAREAYPREEQSALAEALAHEPPEERRPPELERLERELTMAGATAFDLHARLRPVLCQIAGMRLGTRGERLEEAEDELGPELWELVRPDRPAPTDRHAPGISQESLRRVVGELEAL